MSLLEVTDLAVSFPTAGGDLHAVRGLSYHVEPREVVAMVGESGSGKSAAAMILLVKFDPEESIKACGVPPKFGT